MLTTEGTITRHGTFNCYNYYGCRCEACTKANADRHRDQTRDRYKWTAEHGLPPDVQHGRAAHDNWGCRCDICKAAKSEANKKQRAARIAYVAEHGIPDWVQHPGAYTSWGCRCTECVNWRNECSREHYKQKRRSQKAVA